MAKKEFFSFSSGQKRGFSHFVLHMKRRHRGPEVMRPFKLYLWEELNFGQEPVFLDLEVSIFKLFPSADSCVGSRGA